jgi:signal transduction histidine kinase
MKSLYIAVLVLMLGILLFSFLVFRAISTHMERAYFDPVFDSVDELELDDVRSMLESGGPAAVRTYMGKLDRIFGGTHFLLDNAGIDVVSGRNKSSLLPKPPSTKSRGTFMGQVLITHRSADGRFWFVALAPFGSSADWAMYPYYILVASVAGLLCWILAFGVISPIRRITNTVVLFGHGKLDARIHSHRKDEIGQLAASFNQTADRLQRHILTERRLLEDISHELRSPLARLKCAIRLARPYLEKNPAQEQIEQIDRDVDRMASLVADIIQITRNESDPGTTHMMPTDLGTIANAVADDCRIEAHFRQCGIEVQGDLPRHVRGDSELLRRALENLIRNAIRYSPERANVIVTLEQAGNTAITTVRDFGPGVPEDSLARIFDPFYRVEQSRDKDSGGVGLGLSITRRAIQLHHGTIVAENAGPGLRVRITLPLIDP